jgi:hypothetical protein
VADIQGVAVRWVTGREVDCLRRRVFEALGNAVENGYFEGAIEWGDPEAIAEDLGTYSSDLEEVPVLVLAGLVEEYAAQEFGQ